MQRISVLIPEASPPTGNSLMVARCLAANRRVVLHGLSSHAPTYLRYSNAFTSFENYLHPFDLNSWLARIDEIVEKRAIDVVLPISDSSIRTLSEHRQALRCASKLPLLPDHRAFDQATNKALLAKTLRRHGLPHPPTALATAGAPLPDSVLALEFPVLLKPPLSSSGKGIRRFDAPDALSAFLSDRVKGEQWVVQSFIKGRDLGVNVLCKEGQILAATVQHAIKASPKPFEAAIGIEVYENHSAMDVAARLVRTLGWTGVANIDMRVSERTANPLVLEVNGRYWATLLGSLNAGVNFPLLCCQISMGMPEIDSTPHNARYFGGTSSVLVSLVGGGKLGIKLQETDLPYFVQDPLAVLFWLAKNVFDALRDMTARLAGRFH